MIPRKLADKLQELAGYYLVVAITGPRQSGKTTLCRATFPDKPYVSLEALDMQEYAFTDPRAFLEEYRDGAILDEIQQAATLSVTCWASANLSNCVITRCAEPFSKAGWHRNSTSSRQIGEKVPACSITGKAVARRST